MEHALTVHRQRRTRGRVAAEVLEEPERARLLVRGHLRDVLHGGCGDARGAQPSEQRLGVLEPEAIGQPRRQLRPPLHALRVRREAPLERQVERLAEPREEPVVRGGEHQLPVTGRERLVGRDQGERRAVTTGRLPGREVAGEVVAHQADGRLEQREVDRVRPAGVKRRDDGERGPEPRREVDERGADADAGPVGLAGDGDDAGEGLHERVVAGVLAERPLAAERADRDVDDARAALPHRLGAEAEPLGEPRSQALEEDVRARRQAEHRLAAAGGAQVDRDRALPRVGGEEEDALAVGERRAPEPRLVAALGPLDLDDVRSERGEDLGAERAGERRGDVEDADSPEREEARTAVAPGAGAGSLGVVRAHRRGTIRACSTS